jgi:hypothetical protein
MTKEFASSKVKEANIKEANTKEAKNNYLLLLQLNK